MRLLLDAHLSGRRVGVALSRLGHDVFAVSDDRALDGMTDPEVLALATGQERILVTCNVADFPRIVGEWSQAGRRHAGCMIVVGLDHAEFGTLIEVIDRECRRLPDQAAWVDATRFASRHGR